MEICFQLRMHVLDAMAATMADTSLPVRDIGKTTHRHNVSVVRSSCFLHGKGRRVLRKDVISKYSLPRLRSEVIIISGRKGKQSGARNLQRL